jgi:5'-3' exonuclease
MAPAFPQIPILRKALREAGFRDFECDCLEADDLIGILAETAIKKDMFERVVIYSTDKDFYQLATDRVGILRGYDRESPEHVMFELEVAQEIGIPPREWVKVKALTGDPTDNIPKIATGLGPKTAIKMIQAGLDPSFEDFKKHQWTVKQNFQTLGTMWGKVRRNYSLSQIVCSVQDARLPEEVRKNLLVSLADLTRESFLRDRKRLTDESFATFTDWLAEYELVELLGMRQELWRLP